MQFFCENSQEGRWQNEFDARPGTPTGDSGFCLILGRRDAEGGAKIGRVARAKVPPSGYRRMASKLGIPSHQYDGNQPARFLGAHLCMAPFPRALQKVQVKVSFSNFWYVENIRFSHFNAPLFLKILK